MMPFGTSSTALRVTGSTPAEADAIHAYVIDRAQAAYELQRSEVDQAVSKTANMQRGER